MKFPTTTLLTVLVVAAAASSASAAECTTAEIAIIDKGDDPAFPLACPSLFVDGVYVLDTVDSSQYTDELILSMEPCKAKPCLNYLTMITSKSPNCELLGLNIRGVYSNILDLCQKFANGLVITNAPATPTTTKPSTTATTKPTTTATTKPGTTVAPSTTTATTKPSESKDDAVAAPKPATTSPVPAVQSSASSITGVAACATAAVVSALLL